jgi:hypothetical protein
MNDELLAFFRGRVPDTWFTTPVQIEHDRDEALVIGTLADPDPSGLDEHGIRSARSARAEGFREQTRDARMAIARDAESRFEIKVSWAVRIGDALIPFTVANVPVMTRLRLPERQVLDTLIDAGLARSRSEALAWCVRLVRQHQGEWIDELRQAMSEVERVRREGPKPD